jgi:hypothetical protein
MIRERNCGGAATNDNNNDCPFQCSAPTNQKAFPYKWDRFDHLCKSSDPQALPPLRKYGGECSCAATCFTKQAGQLNSPWPWKNASQRAFFHPPIQPKLKLRHQQRYQRGRQLRKKHNHYVSRFGTDYCNSTSKPFKLPYEFFSDFQHHFFFLPDAKLLFCGIPKVGISEFVSFFRYSYGAEDYLSMPHNKNDREEFLLGRLSRSMATQLIQDPTWTKAVFFRDPAERLLSAYLNKIVGEGYTQTVFDLHGNTNESTTYVLNFTAFVDLVTLPGVTKCSNPRGLHACTDPHWKPQVMTCGLDYLLPHMDFIGSFDHLAQHTKELLERVGLWESSLGGATFDDAVDLPPVTSNKCRIPPPLRQSNSTSLIRGFNQRGESKGYSHTTGSKSKLHDYYTPELLAKVRKAYALDYAVWDDLKQRGNVTSVARGRDLDIVKANCRDQQRS